MLAIERQKMITDILLEKKSVSVAELAEHFQVSFETIRRDLRILEEEGIVERSYGGALLKEKVSHTADFRTLSHIMVDVKRNIASMALQFIKPEESIYIDFSTTCGQLVPLLEDIPLNVLTSSLEVMNQLSDKTKIRLFSTGGIWDPENYAFVGNTALTNLSQFHLDKAFISCRALNMTSGISDKSEIEAGIRKKVVECSNKVYLLADNTKFNKAAFVKTCDFSQITAVITDEDPGEEWRRFFEKNQIKCYTCAKQKMQSQEE